MATFGARLQRKPTQLKRDRDTVRRQLTELDPGSNVRLNEIIDGIRGRQDAAPQAWAVKFDRYRRPDEDDTTPGALVARGQLVVDLTPGADRVRTALSALGYEPAPTRTTDGLVRDPSTAVFTSRGRRVVQQLVADVETLREQGITASMNPIVPLGHTIKGDDYPSPTTVTVAPPTATTAANPAVRVAIVDTGITPEARADQWLSSVTRSPENVDFLDVLPYPGDNRLDWFSGHGTFVAGIVQQLAPAVQIRVYRFTTSDGMGTEKDVAEAILRAADDASNDGVRVIINASVGVPAINGQPPVALARAVERLRTDPNVLLVAAAGNNGIEEPMYPAAFEGVIGVGALTAEYEPAPFSNHGDGYVDCSAVGVGIVSTFVAGRMPPEKIEAVSDYTFPTNAWAVWSGTSFSAPQVCAAIARECLADPAITPRKGFELVTADAELLPGYGFAIRDLLEGTSAL